MTGFVVQGHICLSWLNSRAPPHALLVAVLPPSSGQIMNYICDSSEINEYSIVKITL